MKLMPSWQPSWNYQNGQITFITKPQKSLNNHTHNSCSTSKNLHTQLIVDIHENKTQLTIREGWKLSGVCLRRWWRYTEKRFSCCIQIFVLSQFWDIREQCRVFWWQQHCQTLPIPDVAESCNQTNCSNHLKHLFFPNFPLKSIYIFDCFALLVERKVIQ